jgi:uncharacterized membrane protein
MEVFMAEQILQLLERAGNGISLFGVLVIVAGFFSAARTYAFGYRRLGPAKSFRQFKIGLGNALILGLEILVVGDVVETITVKPTFTSLATLALLVVIRTIVSWTLSLEVEGHWPWQTVKGE